MPLNGLAAAQIVDLLGDAPADGNRLLVTGAAGAVGGYVASLAPDRGWQVTGLARAEDEEFVRGLGADFTSARRAGMGCRRRRRGAAGAGPRPGPRRRERSSACRPSAVPAAERGITVAVVVTHPDGARLAELLARAASGELPARVHAVVPLDEVADAHRAVAKGGVARSLRAHAVAAYCVPRRGPTGSRSAWDRRATSAARPTIPELREQATGLARHTAGATRPGRGTWGAFRNPHS